MDRSANVLIVDDNPSIRQTVAAIVRAAGMTPTVVDSGETALTALRTSPIDIVLLDVQLPGMNGLEVLRLARERHPDVGILMLSVLKDKKELAYLRDEVAERGARPFVLGRSGKLRSVVDVADKVAKSSVTVLISGESGTGKEVLARYLHAHSDRKEGPFVAAFVRKTPGLDATTVIALTAAAMQGDRERFLAGGCHGYISKPIDVTRFVAQVEALHARREPETSSESFQGRIAPRCAAK